MADNAPLAELCRLCGIQPEYVDIWGKRHTVASETQRKLLGAMGVRTDAAANLDTVLRDVSERPWRRMVPPVQVASAGAPVAIVLTLPETHAALSYAWTLQLEDGKRLTGTARPAELARLEGRAIDGVQTARYRLPLDGDIPLGYHDFAISTEGGGQSQLRLIIVPTASYQPPALAGDGKLWGPTVQLYALSTRRSWGAGDFTALRQLVEACPSLGAGMIGLNPVHALYPHNPEHASPYSPSSRLFLNTLYIDVESVPEFAASEAAQQLVQSADFQARLHGLRAGTQVDYRGVLDAKAAALKQCYADFRAEHLARNSARAEAFRRYVRDGGAALFRHALFETLQEHFHAADASVWGWPAWPAAYRDPEAPAVAEFAADHAERVEYYQYLQWLADSQLAAAGRRSLELGLGVGLYLDLAVGVDGGGSEVWANQRLYAAGASVGAPPDEYNPKGQDWGIPPYLPEALTEAGYAPFIATLRAAMRQAGALRIDHVMALMRLFWIPKGGSPADGAYVHYPLDDLLGIVALESQRNRCLVIGEDLGTVPDEVRAALAARHILSYRLFYFEKTADGDFKPPASYPSNVLAALSNHDLPTFAGYWRGVDLTERNALGLFPSEAVRDQQRVERAEDRARLLLAMRRADLLPTDYSVDPADSPEMSAELMRAVHRYIAQSPCKLLAVQLEDVLGQVEQVNLPGTTAERPNWRQKLALGLEDLLADPRLTQIAAALRPLRGATPQPASPEPLRAVRIPRATYRLQFHRDFTFAQAAELAPYLARLGVSHVYASPYLKARPGSRHGYDIVDHDAINPEIGTRDDYERFVQALHGAGMGQILDIVPNHMGVASDDNHRWLDVLENGQASAYAGFFDIDWRPAKDRLRGKVLLPVLGDHYGKVLESGELKLAFDAAAGSFAVRYHRHLFPVDPRSYPRVLGHDLDRLAREMPADDPRILEYQSLITGFTNLPAHTEVAEERVKERRREQAVQKHRLATLAQSAPAIRKLIDENVAIVNGGSSEGAAGGLLHELLEQQAYRLAYWRVASDEINYRRFFDIDDLAGLRMEDPEVFTATHRLVLELVAQGKIDGLRIDHPDGLYDPAGYFERLQRRAQPQPPGDVNQALTLYIVAEKILAAYERLPENWPIHGTTGYDFATLVNGLFVHAPHERAFERIYRRFTGQTRAFDDLLYDRKKLIMRSALSSELHVLANALDRISELDHHTRDYSLTALRLALMEVVACFPVYRTYVTGERVTEEDRRYVEWAITQARKRSHAVDVSIFEFIRATLLLEDIGARPGRYRRMAVDFCMRFQQYTGPVMAKGMEDTTFYSYNRLVSLNDVGGDPRRFGISIATFHNANQDRLRRWPHAMLATSTHDSKRGEDVRARINVLSELPEEWSQRLTRWSKLNRRKKRDVDKEPAPDRNDEYLLYQTLVGAWPSESPDAEALAALRARIEAYMLKAMKEAKVHTSWINPNGEYEAATTSFAREILSAPDNPFVADLSAFVQRIARHGLLNSLSQTLLKLTAPGVPDIYQGNELWAFNLVDPDNRRAVDYGLRQQCLAALEESARNNVKAGGDFLSALIASLEDGRAKCYLTWKTLTLRRDLPELFSDGDYLPLATDGPLADHICAFARMWGDDILLVIATRGFARLAAAGAGSPPSAETWRGNWIASPENSKDIRFSDVLTGDGVASKQRNGHAWLAAESVLARFPLALLHARINN